MTLSNKKKTHQNEYNDIIPRTGANFVCESLKLKKEKGGNRRTDLNVPTNNQRKLCNRFSLL
jgi:D-lyxose ketol-isomerase